MDTLSARVKQDQVSFELVRVSGGTWARGCRTQIDETDALKSLQQIRGEELPPCSRRSSRGWRGANWRYSVEASAGR